MYRLGDTVLIFIHQSKDENYNPTIETLERRVKCSLMNSFSASYYVNQSRDMRRTRNIIVPKHNTFDIYQDNKRYQLEYCKLGAVKYKISNILTNRKSNLSVILDCDEVMNE